MTAAQPQPGAEASSYREPTAWVGWIVFAGTIMVMLGIFHVIQGFVALFNEQYFLVGSSGLVVNMDFTTWGWLQIIAGTIVAAAGACLFTGQMWARVVGVLLAMVSALVNISFLAAYPVWSLMMIALDVIVILALTVHGSEMKALD
jgi:hypothetical protein